MAKDACQAPTAHTLGLVCSSSWVGNVNCCVPQHRDQQSADHNQVLTMIGKSRRECLPMDWQKLLLNLNVGWNTKQVSAKHLKQQFFFSFEKLSIENKATLIKNIYINIYSNNSVPRTKRRLDPKSAAGNSQFSAALVYWWWPVHRKNLPRYLNLTKIYAFMLSLNLLIVWKLE